MKELSHGPSHEMLIFSLKAELPMQSVSIGLSMGIVSGKGDKGENNIVEILKYYSTKLSLAVQNNQQSLKGLRILENELMPSLLKDTTPSQITVDL